MQERYITLRTEPDVRSIIEIPKLLCQETAEEVIDMAAERGKTWRELPSDTAIELGARCLEIMPPLDSTEIETLNTVCSNLDVLVYNEQAALHMMAGA